MKKAFLLLLIFIVFFQVAKASSDSNKYPITITLDGKKVTIDEKSHNNDPNSSMMEILTFKIEDKKVSMDRVKNLVDNATTGDSEYLLEAIGLRKAFEEVASKIRKVTYQKGGDQYLLRICLIIGILIFVYEYTTGKEVSMKTWIGAIMIIFFLLFYTEFMPLISKAISHIAHSIFSPNSFNTQIFSEAKQKLYGEMTGGMIPSVKGVIIEISFIFVTLATTIASFVIYIVQGLMYLAGPIALTIAIIPKFRGVAWKFFKNYIGVSFWGVTLSFMLLIVDQYTKYLANMMNASNSSVQNLVTQGLPESIAKQLASGDSVTFKIIAINLLLAFFIIAIPKITKLYLSWPIEQANRMASSIIQKTTAMLTLAQSKGVQAIVGGSKIAGKTANRMGSNATSGSISKAKVENNLPKGAK